MKIHYFNCGCQGHYGDYVLYLITQKLFKKVGSDLSMDVEFVAHPEEADLILFGGGTVLGMFYWHQIYQLNKPTAVFGSGLAAPKLPELVGLQKLLKRCLLVGVRGSRTQKALKQIGVNAQVIGDPVFCLDVPEVTVEPRLAVGGVRKDTTGSSLLYFRDVYNFLRQQGWNVQLWRMGGADRGEFFGFPVYLKSLDETIGAIAQSNLVVGQRLHMSLIGLVSKRKVIGFDYVWNKMEDALSVLNYPYYLSQPSFERFKEMYFQLLEDSQIMVDVQRRVSHLQKLQATFARQILEKSEK